MEQISDKPQESAGEEHEGFISGDEARETFPTQIAAALRYASDNKYDYGPKLRDSDLDWDVEGVGSMGNGISRVYLRFKPSTSFRGESGAEYLDVDSSGAVLARRQLRVPKQQLPVFLIGFAIVSLLALAVIQVLLWANPFEGGPDPYVAGRILWLRAESAQAYPFIVYDAPSANGEDMRWSIKPAGDGTEVVVVETTLINQTSGAVNMVIDRDAAELRIRGSIGLKPIDIISDSYTVNADEDGNYLSQFMGMWGSVTLDQGEQITGHMVFEAPKGSDFSEFRWLAGDTAVVRY